MAYDPAAYWSEVAKRVGARAPSGDWDLAGNDGPFHRYKRSLTLERLSTLDVAGRSVLELGPGPGGNLRALRDYGASRLVGCEVAPEMVSQARRNLGSDADIRQFDGQLLPLDDREVDVAVTVTVLQHNTDEMLVQLINELTRVCGATLELVEDTTTFRPRSAGGSYFVRDINEYIALVTARGFRLVNVQYMNCWASERAWLLVQRIGQLASRRGYFEGQPVTRAEVTVEGMLLHLTQKIDPLLPPLSGGTAMRFARN